MRFNKVGADGHTFKVRGDDESVSGISYLKEGSSVFVESFGVGEGYLRLKNTATASLPSSPDTGAVAWDTTLGQPVFYNGSAWVAVPIGSGLAYEEGTWTPRLTDSTNDATHGIQYGLYEVIGRRVWFTGHLTITGKGSLSGSLFIEDLPYSSLNGASSANVSAVAVGWADDVVITAGETIGGRVQNLTSRIQLSIWNATTGTSGLQASEIDTTFNITFSGHYVKA